MLRSASQELNWQNRKLGADLAETTAQWFKLSNALETERAHTSSIQREYKAYKKEYKISGNLGALQSAVAEIETKLEERRSELRSTSTTTFWRMDHVSFFTAFNKKGLDARTRKFY